MRKRINNDLKISWEILRNGQAEDFTTATNIAVKAVIPNAYSIEVPYERIDNLFHIAVPANTLKLGTYHLILSYNKPDAAIEGGIGTISIDQKNAFQIVRHTEDESDDGRDITGNIVIPGIPSGGTEGQYLAKVNGTSYNTEWKSPEQSTGVSTINIMSQKAITDALALKVDKVTGKQLSTEDYSTEEKNKLSGIAESANNYVHPTNHPPSIITQDENNRFVTDVEKGVWNGKQDALGFTPENVANKKTSIADNDTDYPSSKAVKTFIEAAVAQKSFYANTMTVNFGTLNQGTVADLDEVGGTDVIIQELVGANPLTVTFDFSNVTEVTAFVFYGQYLGGAMHQVYIEAYNYVLDTWDLKLIIGTDGAKKWYTAPIYNANAYLSEGNMQVRFRHIGTGISSHQLVLDYVEINSGGSGGQTNISASSVNFVPSGNLSATNVASALVELDTEKLGVSQIKQTTGNSTTEIMSQSASVGLVGYEDIVWSQGGFYDTGDFFATDGMICTLNYHKVDGQLISLYTEDTIHAIKVFEYDAYKGLISVSGWLTLKNLIYNPTGVYQRFVINRFDELNDFHPSDWVDNDKLIGVRVAREVLPLNSYSQDQTALRNVWDGVWEDGYYIGNGESFTRVEMGNWNITSFIPLGVDTYFEGFTVANNGAYFAYFEERDEATYIKAYNHIMVGNVPQDGRFRERPASAKYVKMSFIDDIDPSGLKVWSRFNISDINSSEIQKNDVKNKNEYNLEQGKIWSATHVLGLDDNSSIPSSKHLRSRYYIPYKDEVVINVKAGYTFILLYYDSQKRATGVTSGSPKVISKNDCAYFRLCIYKINNDDISTVDDIGLFIDGATQGEVVNSEDVFNKKDYAFAYRPTKIDYAYSGLPAFVMPDVPRLNFMYDLYDSLLNAHPSYVTKINCDIDSGLTTYGENLTANPDFNAGDTLWSKEVDITIIDQGGGDYEAVATNANTRAIYQALTGLTIGKKYTLTAEITEITSGAFIPFAAISGYSPAGDAKTTTGVIKYVFEATYSIMNIGIRTSGVTNGKIGYIKVREYDMRIDDYPIYMYKFSPAYGCDDNNPALIPPKKIVKVFITTLTHGNEVVSAVGCYNMMKAICEDWAEYESLEQLRWNVEFYIIPVLNPYGFSAGVGNAQITNYNGVDLDRNMPYLWVASGEGTVYYSGASAGSEHESKILMHYLNSVKPDIYIDHHNFSSSDNGFQLFGGTISRMAASVMYDTFSRCTRKWKKDYPLVYPQDDTTMLGAVSTTPVQGGMTDTYAHSLGILSAYFEGSYYLSWTEGKKTVDMSSFGNSQVVTQDAEALTYFIIRLIEALINISTK